MLARRPNVSTDASVAQTHCRREDVPPGCSTVLTGIESAPPTVLWCSGRAQTPICAMLGHIAVSHALVRDPDPYVPALSQERSVQCQAWTLERERRVVEFSRGQVDYCAPRGCLRADRVLVDRWLGYDEETSALVVDLRYNEGGAFGFELGELLSRQPMAALGTRWSGRRYVPVGARRRRSAVIANRFTSLAETQRERAGARIICERTLGGAIRLPWSVQKWHHPHACGWVRAAAA